MRTDWGSPPKFPPRPPTHLGGCAAPGGGGGGSLLAGAGEGSLSRPGGSLGPHSKPGGVLGGFPKGRRPPEEGKGGSEGGSPCAGGSRVRITNTPGCSRGGHDPPSGGICGFGGGGTEVKPPPHHDTNPIAPSPNCCWGGLSRTWVRRGTPPSARVSTVGRSWGARGGRRCLGGVTGGETPPHPSPPPPQGVTHACARPGHVSPASPPVPEPARSQ